VSDDANIRLLIFGCGYIGTAVADAALARGWTVTALTRNAAHARQLTSRGILTVVADLADAAWHAQVDRAQDVILNTVSSGGGGLEGYQRAYVEGTRSILAWAGERVDATFIYTGSTSVYPQGAGEMVTEETPAGEGGSEAARPLLEAERLIRESTCFARWFILRLAGIYGPGRHYLVDQLRAGATVFPGTGKHRLNLAHRDDIVSAILACAQAPAELRNEIFNVADDAPVPKEEVTAWLAGQLGVTAPIFVRNGGELPPGAARVRGRSGPVPDRRISNSKLQRMLGWRPAYPGFRDGYRQIFTSERSPGSVSPP
jgi:nucleoside-diphosphate-sugar epimerase